MIRERSELDAIASEIHVSGRPIALDLETYGTSEDNKIRKVEGRTILGRRRLINQEASNLDCFQAKTNLVVQGACADGLKLALCEIHKALPKDAKIITTVRDEISVEAPEAQAEQVKKLLAKIMVSVFDKLFKKQVPIEVDAKICENWGENEGVCDVCAGLN